MQAVKRNELFIDFSNCRCGLLALRFVCGVENQVTPARDEKGVLAVASYIFARELPRSAATVKQQSN